MIEFTGSKRIALLLLSSALVACGEEETPTASATTNMPPNIAGVPMEQVSVGTTYSFQPTATDPNADPLVFGVEGNPAWLKLETATGRLSGTPASQHRGTHRGIVVWVTDGSKQSFLPAFDVEVVDGGVQGNSPPTLTGSAPQSVVAGKAYAFTPTALDADGDTLTFGVQNLPDWATFNSGLGRIEGTPDIDDVALYERVVITVSDGKAGVALPAFDVLVTVPNVNTPPTIKNTPATFALQGVPYVFQPSATDVDGDTLTFDISNRPAWASFNPATGRLAGTPDESHVGNFGGIRISVSDGNATASLAEFSISVSATNSPPTILGDPSTVALEDKWYVFRPSASDADGDSLVYSITGLPSWARFDISTGRLSGTPDVADVGTYGNIAIAVSDGVATANLAPFSITVAAVNDRPTISGTPAASVAEGVAYSFVPSASDANDDSLTFNIVNSPSWATFNANTGALSGTPTAGSVGTKSNIVISVSDGTLSSSLPTFSITVTGVNGAPTISGTPPTSVLLGNAYSFVPTADDEDDDSLTFSIVNKPSWAGFNAATGGLQGTPTAGDVGSYSNIRISVSDGSESVSLSSFSIAVNSVANGTATLSWTPPTENTDGSPLTHLAGFKVYWGTSSGNYPNSITLNNPGLATYVVENLASGTYYFATKAFNSSGVESTFSNEGSKTIQ